MHVTLGCPKKKHYRRKTFVVSSSWIHTNSFPTETSPWRCSFSYKKHRNLQEIDWAHPVWESGLSFAPDTCRYMDFSPSLLPLGQCSHLSGEQPILLFITAEHSFTPIERKSGKKQASKAFTEVLAKSRLIFMGRMLDRGKVCPAPQTFSCCSISTHQAVDVSAGTSYSLEEAIWYASNPNFDFHVLLGKECCQQTHFDLELWFKWGIPSLKNDIESNRC